MDHVECLNILLSNACSNPTEEEGIDEYEVELHCCSFSIRAKKRLDSEGKHRSHMHYGSSTKDERWVYEYDIQSILANRTEPDPDWYPCTPL